MKERRNLLIGIILGFLLGWTSGFLRLPHIDKNFSFGMGFLACLSLLLLSGLILFVWKKNIQLTRLLGNNISVKDFRNATKINILVWLMITVVIVIGSLTSGYLLFKQAAFLEDQVQQQKQQMAQQSELMETTKSSSLIILMTHLFDKIDNELKSSPTRTLRDETIERIAALNYSFKPHRYLEADSLSSEKLSPERGQLLLVLSKMKMDSASFEKIKLKVSFLGADLRKANLAGVNLKGVDLRKANLKEADLSAANLHHANLKEANLWGANLKESNLDEAILNNANLKWSVLNEANLGKANLNGADLSEAKLRGVNSEEADLSWGKLIGASLHGANLPGADLTGTDLGRANLSKTNLTGANLNLANLSEANLSKTILTGVKMAKATVEEKDWFEKIEQWGVEGAKEIQGKYKITKDVAGQYNYRLKAIEE